MTNGQAGISTKHLDFAGNELKRMKLLVDKVLSYGKMNEGQFELNKTYVQLDTIVADAVNIMRGNANSAQINIGINEPISLLGDEVLLTNMLTSLLDNALKYNQLIPEVFVALKRSGNNAMITIRDNGTGIPGAYHRKVFEPFFRVPTGNAHDVKGHGLGLSLVAQVIKLHNGTIGIESNQQGTTFIIMLPNVHL